MNTLKGMLDGLCNDYNRVRDYFVNDYQAPRRSYVLGVVIGISIGFTLAMLFNA